MWGFFSLLHRLGVVCCYSGVKLTHHSLSLLPEVSQLSSTPPPPTHPPTTSEVPASVRVEAERLPRCPLPQTPAQRRRSFSFYCFPSCRSLARLSCLCAGCDCTKLHVSADPQTRFIWHTCACSSPPTDTRNIVYSVFLPLSWVEG